MKSNIKKFSWLMLVFEIPQTKCRNKSAIFFNYCFDKQKSFHIFLLIQGRAIFYVIILCFDKVI